MSLYTIPEDYLYPHSGKSEGKMKSNDQKTTARHLMSIYQDRYNLLREAEKLSVNIYWEYKYNALLYQFSDKSGILFYD